MSFSSYNKKSETIFNRNSAFIIAELSANHNGAKENAINAIKAARKAGADAIKLQTYTPDTITINCDNKYFKINHGSIWDGQTLYDLYKEAYTPWDWHKELFEVAKQEGLICFSSPFDNTAVDFLEKLNCPIYKVASPEITDIPLIKYIASKKKPIILSSGLARLEDIQLAINTIRKISDSEIALLKCTSAYPTQFEDANLLTISDIYNRFHVTPGLSDHTLGIVGPVVGVTQGAKIIEKHFIFDKSIGGPDASFSLDFNEFKQMVESVRSAEKLLGEIDYSLSPKLEKTRLGSMRSIFVFRDIIKGEAFTKKNVKSVRPGYGLHPAHIDKVLGKKAKKNYTKGTPVTLEMVEK